MEEKILGQWGRMRRAHLMEHRPATFSTIVTRGELFLAQMLAQDPAPDRNADPMAWVRHMNAVKAQAEEIIREELIYT